jgi:LCP family protein required for cell wall assembly
VKHKKVDDTAASRTDLGRANAAEGYAAKRKKRTRKKGLVIALVVVLVVLLGGAGAAWAYFSGINAKLNAGVTDDLLNSLSDTEADEPFYMLLLGVDKSTDRANSAEYGESDSAYRSDSMMLARIDPQNKQVTLVSLHRDTLMDFGEHGKQKLNAAYSIGGPSYVVEVVSKLAGVPITHYAEIDFDQFVSVVDTLGGIEVNVPRAIDDELAGGSVPAGEQTLNGEQALILCRSRHSFDDVGDGDVYRAANQRMVIAAIAKKILSSDVATMTASIDTCADAVTTDMSLSDIMSLAMQMRGIDTDTDIYSGMEPTTSIYTNDTWYELLDTDAWKTMMSRVDQGLSPYASADEDVTQGYAGSTQNIKNESDSTSSNSGAGTSTSGILGGSTSFSTDYSGDVTVLNGAGVSGLAAKIATSLSNMGFTTTTGNTQNHFTDSMVVYTAGTEDRAEAVNQALGGNLQVIENTGQFTVTGDCVVILGEDMADQA